MQAQFFDEEFGLRAPVRHANVHVVIPTNMNEAALAFQPAPKLFPQHLSNHIADLLKRENCTVTKFERKLPVVLDSLDGQRIKATLLNKGGGRVDVGVFYS